MAIIEVYLVLVLQQGPLVYVLSVRLGSAVIPNGVPSFSLFPFAHLTRLPARRHDLFLGRWPCCTK
jgi:hypothetical protein